MGLNVYVHHLLQQIQLPFYHVPIFSIIYFLHLKKEDFHPHLSSPSYFLHVIHHHFPCSFKSLTGAMCNGFCRTSVNTYTAFSTIIYSNRMSFTVNQFKNTYWTCCYTFSGSDAFIFIYLYGHITFVCHYYHVVSPFILFRSSQSLYHHLIFRKNKNIR